MLFMPHFSLLSKLLIAVGANRFGQIVRGGAIHFNKITVNIKYGL